jgi:phytoene dehydrogenase-like protein
LWQAAHDGSAIGSASYARGGMGALSEALAKAAMAAGAEIRTRANVSSIAGADSDKPKVVLEDGAEIESRVVVSNADPRTTFLSLVDPVDLDPDFLLKMRNYRAPGAAAKINLALSGLPAFRGLNGSDAKLSGRIHISNARLTRRSMVSFPRSRISILRFRRLVIRRSRRRANT